MRDEHVACILLFMMFASANIDSIRGLSFLLKDRGRTKPLITCLSAPPGIWDKHINQFEEAGILVNFPTPERAAKVMINLNRYRSLITEVPKARPGAMYSNQPIKSIGQ